MFQGWCISPKLRPVARASESRSSLLSLPGDHVHLKQDAGRGSRRKKKEAKGEKHQLLTTRLVVRCAANVISPPPSPFTFPPPPDWLFTKMSQEHHMKEGSCARTYIHVVNFLTFFLGRSFSRLWPRFLFLPLSSQSKAANNCIP